MLAPAPAGGWVYWTHQNAHLLSAPTPIWSLESSQAVRRPYFSQSKEPRTFRKTAQKIFNKKRYPIGTLLLVSPRVVQPRTSWALYLKQRSVMQRPSFYAATWKPHQLLK